MAEKIIKEAAMVTCPPLVDYPVPDEDMSKSELVPCPKCTGQMWLSEKKKAIIAFCNSIEKPVIMGCYRCIKKLIEKNPSILKDMVQVNI